MQEMGLVLFAGNADFTRLSGIFLLKKMRQGANRGQTIKY